MLELLPQIAVTEAVKAVVASLAGSAIPGVSRLLTLVRGRLGRLPADPDRLKALIARQAEADPDFIANLMSALAELGRGGGAVSPPPPDPYHDRDELRRKVASSKGIWVITGPSGVGKTAFTHRVAHDAAGQFPHGQVYLDLDDGWRDGDLLRSDDVQSYVLSQLGVARVETTAAALNQQYLSALVYHRFVLIIENALGVEEVRLLAQPWPYSLVLVTARRLTDDLRMWAPAERLAQLRGLDEEAAWRLLASRSGGVDLAAERGAARRLLALCDWMPSPIMQAAFMLERRGGTPGAVAAVLARLERAGPEGIAERCVVRTVEQLEPASVAAVRVLATHPGRDFTYESAAAMLGPAAPAVVDELLDAGLAEPERGRLRLTHTARGYALRDPGPDQAARADQAFDQLLDFYSDRALAAEVAEIGDRLRTYPVPEGTSWDVPAVKPVEWLEAESANLVEVVAAASRRGQHHRVVQLCGALEVLLTYRGHYRRCAEAFEWGIRSAEAIGDPAMRCRLYAVQGRAYTLLHSFDEAARRLAAAAQLVPAVDNPRLVSSVWELHARLHEEQAGYHPAPDYPTAISYLDRALALDERAGLERPRGLHRRMKANLLVKAGQPEQARALLEPVTSSGEPRNDARVHMVLAKAHTALGDLPAAREALVRARALLAGTAARQYELELADVEAEIALRAGDVEAARAGWGYLARRHLIWGHPALRLYLLKLDRLPPPPA